MDVQQFITRARKMQGRRTVYWPGAGGREPGATAASETVKPALVWAGLSAAEQLELAPLAAAAGIDLTDRDAVREACDCSGFVCWALGLARRQSAVTSWTSADGWINTDSIWRDATGAQVLFLQLAPGHLRIGALLVYPKPADAPYGHVGIVTAVSPHGQAMRVLHCSAENFKSTGDAVGETSAAPFDPAELHSVSAWYRPFGDGVGDGESAAQAQQVR